MLIVLYYSNCCFGVYWIQTKKRQTFKVIYKDVSAYFLWMKRRFFLQFAEVIDDDVQYIWIKEPTSTKLSVCNAMICSMSLVERGTSSYFTSPCIRFFWSVDFVQENVGIQGVPINMGIQWRIWYRLFK